MDWIIGGTKDSRDFIKLLSEKNINLKNIILTLALKAEINTNHHDRHKHKRLGVRKKPVVKVDAEIHRLIFLHSACN